MRRLLRQKRQMVLSKDLSSYGMTLFFLKECFVALQKEVPSFSPADMRRLRAYRRYMKETGRRLRMQHKVMKDFMASLRPL